MPDFIPYTWQQLEHVLSSICKAIYQPIAPLAVTAYRTTEPVTFDQRTSGEELSLRPGDKWGDLFECAWFHFTGQIPADAAGQSVVLVLDVNGELLVVDAQGNPARGLTNGSSVFDFSLGRPGKRILPVTAEAKGGETIDVWADAGCNDLFGNLQQNGTLKEAHIAICQPEVRALFYDFEVLHDLLKLLPEQSPRYRQLLTALNDAAWSLAHGLNNETAAKARAILRPQLAKQGGDPALHITAIGHAHIDLGWLWPIRETKRKGARTFATALANMERYPAYVFGASQPQLFQWIKEDYPELYERVKQRVQDGRFEAQGAMWVEADTNVSGGEALVRQVLYGKRFFQQEFGVEMNYLWLPDVFGYSAALPQILKKAGVDYFMTQKMSWNQVNKFPHHSFYWQGIDGTAILSHMLPEETYNSPALPHSVDKIEKNYFDAGVSDQTLLLHGIGDGGGGPGEEHLERLERLRNLAPLSPVTQGTAADFFPRWAKDSARFPTWVGELYLERHSGTLTSEANNKWYNRRMEQSLRELEWTAVLAGGQYPAPRPYPAGRLLEIWREVLLYQFHDILPGSSIKRVYDESLACYRLLHAEVEDLICQYEDQLARRVNTAGMRAPVVLFNSLAWPRTEWVSARGQWQQVTVPAMGYAAVDMANGGSLPAGSALPTLKATGTLLENDLLRVQFGADGTITSLLDKTHNREVIPAGECANRLAVYRDPGDAWDFPLDYANQTPRPMALAASRAWIDGPCALLEQTYRIGQSEVVQTIRLTAGSRRLEFATQARWRERESMLRTSFPVAVHAEESTSEIQFGHVRRPTHTNTSWDLAKDEVAAHKWVDLSQRDYGVALLNDSKYGHHLKGSVIDLNLLRSVPYPGYNTAVQQDVPLDQPHPGYTDQSDFAFSYALYPHAGDLVAGEVVQQGYAFNTPLRVSGVEAQPGDLPTQAAYLTVDSPSIVVEAVKQAEDSDAAIIRLYESSHASVTAKITFGGPVSGVEETDLMEQTIRALTVEGNAVTLAFKPFEIKTIKVK